MTRLLTHSAPRSVLLASALIFTITGAWAEVGQKVSSEVDPARVMAYQGDAVLTQDELDAAFRKLPEKDRLNFIRDGGKVDQLIGELLKRKSIAADAAAAEFDQDPLIAARLQLESEKLLAELWLRHIVEQAPRVDIEALAYEDFIANPNDYSSPETLDVSHILIATGDRSHQEARTRAESVEAMLREEPSRFESLVAEYSDDPAKKENVGRYAELRRGMAVAPFEKAAFQLKKPGDISAPVLTDYGYHIILLNGRSGGEPRKYEEVKEEAIARAEQRYLDNYLDNYLRKLLSEPLVIPTESVEIMAKRHFGEDFELAPSPPR